MKTGMTSQLGKGSLCCIAGIAMAFGVVSLTAESEAEAARFKPCICPHVYAPVTCDGGAVFSNQCFANCAEATGCVPGILF